MIKLKQFPIYSEQFLRKPCKPVVDAQEAKELVAKILDKYPEEGALGVACPQIGIHKQAFVMRLQSEDTAIFVCNPEIVEQEEPFIFNNEGCLSFPGKRKNTVRYKRVKVKYRDERFEERTVLADDVEAVIFQHEIDHLNGVLYKDRVQQSPKAKVKIGRNEPCSCNSGKKYKKCCGG